MLYPPINELLDIASSRYILVNQVAKRARQIVDTVSEERKEKKEKDKEKNEIVNVPKLEKPVTTATLEVYNGKIKYTKINKEDLIIEE